MSDAKLVVTLRMGMYEMDITEKDVESYRDLPGGEGDRLAAQGLVDALEEILAEAKEDLTQILEGGAE